MRESAIPYAAVTRIIDAWIDGGDAPAILNEVPEHLQPLVKYGAVLMADNIKRWAMMDERSVPRAVQPLVERYLESRRK